MVSLEDFTKDMKEVGLTDYQIRTYWHLSQYHDWCKAVSISRLSGVPQSKVYCTLFELENKGLVKSAFANGEKVFWGNNEIVEEVEKLRNTAKKLGFRLKRVAPSNRKNYNRELNVGRPIIRVFKALPLKNFLNTKVAFYEKIRNKWIEKRDYV